METAQQHKTYPFLMGGGEMGRLTRDFDWLPTAVGLPDTWPQSLRTTVSNLLRSRFPMFLWWGDERVQFYNDAYRPSLGSEGKHPAALGQKGKDCWPETWATLSPLLQQVQATGEATWQENQLIPIYRNGRLEDAYWTFSYSLVLDDDDRPGGILVTCIETTETVLAHRNTEEREKTLRNIILQAPLAICIFRGPSFVIEVANEKMFEFWGKTAGQVMHKPLFAGIPEARGQGYEELMTTVMRTGEPFSASELPVKLPRDRIVQTVFINFTYHPLWADDGSVSGIMAMATDVTEQVLARQKIEELVALRTRELAAANERLQRSNKELERSNTYLEEFTHAASHDLKEPVRKIHHFTHQLKSVLFQQLKESERLSFTRIESAAERMNHLIDDLLVYSHVSQRPHKKESVDLTEQINRVLEDLEVDIQEKKAVVHVKDMPVLPGHRRQLQQLFQNLISNSLKYCRPDVAPEITIAATEATDNGRAYHAISIQDNGIGFDPQYNDQIFQIFTRLHARHEYSGTGVGLSIVKKVVENHDGFIRVESAPGQGATFSVFLPE